MKTVGQLITELAGQGEKITVFCGAGISVKSGVPLAIPFLSAILDCFGLAKKDKALLILKNNKLAMPFELFFDVFLKSSEDYQLLDVFKIGQPNTNHHFIAHCYRTGKCDEIYTTNFDTHIETACGHMPLISYVREDQFAAAVTSTAVPKLIKLHGSIIDMTSIRTTLSSIARRNLSDERVKIIDHLFEKKTRILILGYSCSDYFDIVDRIGNIKGSSAEIYFIDHQESGMSVEKVSAKAPFSNFNGYQVKINTDVFIEELWNAMGTGYIKQFNPVSNWREVVADWLSKQVDDQRKYTIAARLFYNIDQFKISLKYLKKAARTISRKDKLAYSRSLINIGVMHFHLKNLPKANRFYEKALSILQGSIYYYETASLLNNFALNLYKQDSANRPQAILYLEQTLSIVHNHTFEQSPICKAGALCNLGLIEEYENNDDLALDYYFQALSIDIDIKGDKPGEIELNRYIARIYKKKGNTTLSDKHLNRANQLADPFHKKINTDYDITKR